MALTAYLVNESRARRPELAMDTLARSWIPEPQRPEVRALWDDYARAVYPHDDLVVSLRCRCVRDVLAQALADDPATALVVCGAGFSSYPWLLSFPTAVEVDLPAVAAAKQQRAAALADAGVVPARPVTHLAADLADSAARDRVADRVRTVVDGRPVVYVAEGLLFFLPDADARAVAGWGAGAFGAGVSVVTYWPTAARDNAVLAAQRGWFARWGLPESASHLTVDDLSVALGGVVDNYSTEELQRRYLGEVTVAEKRLVPEHVAVCQS